MIFDRKNKKNSWQSKSSKHKDKSNLLFMMYLNKLTPSGTRSKETVWKKKTRRWQRKRLKEKAGEEWEERVAKRLKEKTGEEQERVAKKDSRLKEKGGEEGEERVAKKEVKGESG